MLLARLPLVIVMPFRRFWNPDSVLGGAGQDPQNGDQGSTGDATSQSNLVKLEETPDNPTLTGDLSKTVTGVLC